MDIDPRVSILFIVIVWAISVAVLEWILRRVEPPLKNPAIIAAFTSATILSVSVLWMWS